jgi:hypothetical protein
LRDCCWQMSHVVESLFSKKSLFFLRPNPP